MQPKISGCPYHRTFLAQQALPSDEAKPKVSESTHGHLKVPLDQVTKTVKEHADNPGLALKELHAKYGPAFEVETGDGTLRFDHNSDTMRRALTQTDSGEALFKKSDKQSHGLARVLGRDNLLLSSGDNWESSRGALKDFFSVRNMRTDERAESISKIMDRHLSEVAKEVESEGKAEVDLGKLFRKATLDVALNTLFTSPPTTEKLEKLSEAYVVVNERVGKEWILPASITGLEEPEENFQKAVGTIKDWASHLVEERMKKPDIIPDALGALMTATDPDTGAPYSKKRLESEVLNLMLAGHETTANLITWTLTDLARTPLEQNQLANEIKSGIGDAVPSASQLKALGTLQKTWRQEAAEHPPNFLLAREVLSDTQIGPAGDPVEVTKGTTLLMSTEHVNAENKGVFSFGAGKRFCLGAALATTETEVAITRFLQKFEVTDSGMRGVHSGLTQLPADTLVTVRKRKNTEH